MAGCREREALSMNPGLVAELRAIVGSHNVSTDAHHLDRFAGDALGVFRAFRSGERLSDQPGVVVWPGDTSEVSRVLKLANGHQVAVVPYGGGTGVMGAAAPVDGCIVLNLRRMNSILDVSKENLSIRLQAGALLGEVAAELERSELVLGHDPWSQPIATVGGAISTNGVGYTAAKYGSMGEQVLGLVVVLADGETVQTKDVPKASYGPSLNGLFIGSEGTLGVITEATVRAFAWPEKRILRGVTFPDFDTGFNAVAALYADGVRPTMVDYGEEFWRGSSTSDQDATLYLAFEGFREDADAQDQRARDICARLGGREDGPDEVQRFWTSRHASAERYRRDVLLDPNPRKARNRRSDYRMDYLHVALPTSKVLEYRRRCQEVLAGYKVEVREWSLWARPEFFSFLISEDGDPEHETSLTIADAVDQVLVMAQDMGGTMEYCHGVGIKLAHLMDRELGTGMEIVRKIKTALDPNGILNPGKLAG